MSDVSVRDDRARAVASRLTSKHVHRVPDPALMLTAAPERDADRLLRDAGIPADGSPIVGVAVRRWFHHRTTLIPHKYATKCRIGENRGRRRFERMTVLLAGVLDELAAEHGAFTLFLPTYNVAHEGDDQACKAVMRHMRSTRASLLRIHDPKLYKALTGRLSVMLGGRMHPTIFSAAMGTPVVALAYNQKFEGFFRLLGREQYVISVDKFVHEEKTHELREMLSRSLSMNGDDTGVDSLIEETRNFTRGLLN
jgi:polysaccharide pyruvyl transferase WcaK-like protein